MAFLSLSAAVVHWCSFGWGGVVVASVQWGGVCPIPKNTHLYIVLVSPSSVHLCSCAHKVEDSGIWHAHNSHGPKRGKAVTPQSPSFVCLQLGYLQGMKKKPGHREVK
jgi:hypothetical protein